ncbi:hypothetical protein AB833_01005 [Chromatiales bacterium (ex Bugula neritina AB1)]|nr:hypothetical protein AB833_01005 [Chromatiales bacterium (ex Bugula neritina AB1)]
MNCSTIAKSILRTKGWKVVGNYPVQHKKLVLVAAPHTSNWDFPLGVLVRAAIQQDIKFVGKDTLFKPPLGWLLSAMGGVGVDRTKSSNFVDAVVAEFLRREKFAILFAAEGSRRKVEKFKTGFYYIASKAGAPILPTVLNYASKEFTFLEPFFPTENAEKDIAEIEDLFAGIRGLRPELGFRCE